MDNHLNNEDSYANRRKIFKHIWDTAMQLDDVDFLAKPKVIKTLRLDEVDKTVGKKKKQRIKNLRTVCKKILDFCDRQDAEDLYYHRVTTDGAPCQEVAVTKMIRRKRNSRSPVTNIVAPVISTKRKIHEKDVKRVSRNTSPIKIPSLKKSSTKKKKPIKAKLQPDIIVTTALTKHITEPEGKVKQKRKTKQRKTSARRTTTT